MAYFEVKSKPRLTFPTLTDSIVTFNSQYAGLPLKSHSVEVVATQSGSGTPSPDNIRSINGHDSIIIGNCDSDIAYLWTVDSSFTGAVLFNQIYNYTSGSTTGLGVVRTISSGLISFSGESTSAGNSVTFAWTDFTVPNGHKVIVLKDFTLPEGDFIFDQYNGYANVDITNTIMNVSAGFLIPQLKVSGAGHDYTGISGHLSVIDLTVMFGSTIADYIYNLEQGEAGAGVAFFKHMYPDNYYPYNAGTKEGVGVSTVIQIGSTVYGGEYDARTGVFTVTHGFVDLGTLNWNRYTTESTQKIYFRTSSEISDCIKSTSTNLTYGMTCSNYVEGAWTNVLDASGYDLQFALGWGNRSYIAIYDSGKSEMTAADFKTAMNGVQLIYPLATPTTIQLPPCPIDTLEGVNNIWADTGNTTLQYPKFG